MFFDGEAVTLTPQELRASDDFLLPAFAEIGSSLPCHAEEEARPARGNTSDIHVGGGAEDRALDARPGAVDFDGEDEDGHRCAKAAS